MKYKIRKGLNLPITGGLSSQNVEGTKTVTKVALVGSDYVGMKPTMLVNEGDVVKIGQPLFECKKNVGVIYTSPASGKVLTIKRGERRAFEAIVISKDGDEHVTFKNFQNKPTDSLTRDEVESLLVESGEWTALRQRPYEKSATLGGKPKSIFVNAMDTNPLALDPAAVIAARKEDFENGIKVLSKLTEGKVYVCHQAGAQVAAPADAKVQKIEFAGPHPAGNVGTHIHFVDPISPSKYVWHAHYQDVIAIGSLFKTGKIDLERVVSVAGPLVKKPKVVKVPRGASVDQVLSDEIDQSQPVRAISGSVLNGHKAVDETAYLGRYHLQITAIKEDAGREFLGWQSPGFDKFSVKNIYVSKLIPSKKFSFTSNRNGSFRALVPIGSYEKVMPLDILATPLLRSLLAKDTDSAQDLGCLELAEEDVALMTFVDPGKVDFGPLLRETLSTIEKDG